MRDCGVPNSSHPSPSAARQRLAVVVGFSRPHTIIGTVVSVCGLFVLAVALDPAGDPGIGQLVAALVAGLAVNVYIVGLNQLTDVDLDRINKPWLPLAAGSLSRRAATRLVVGALAVTVVVGAIGSAWLLGAVVLAAALGTAYSLPPVRLKRYHPLAAACIVAVRGLVVNLLVFAHFAAAPGTGLPVPPPVLALTLATVVIGLVIAWFKDLGDMEGDRRFAVGTLALRVGPRRVVALGVGGLLATYAALIAASRWGIPGVHPGVVGAGHAALAALLVVTASRLELTDADSIARFYRWIWRLFYAEYALFAVAAVLG